MFSRCRAVKATQRLRNIDQQKKLISSSRCIPRPLKVNLSLHLKGHTNLVATRVNIATVDKGGESDCDAVPQLLLVSKSNLALVVDLSAQCRSIRENIFCSNSKVVAAEAELHPRETPVSRAGDTFW